MFTHPLYASPYGSLGKSEMKNEYLGLSQALDLYQGLRLRGQLLKVLTALFFKPRHLLDLSSQVHQPAEMNRYYGGMQAVALDQIRGSEGRVRDFDRYFNPLNDKTRGRWLSVASARLSGLPLPPVELIQVGDIYFVRDGHHRISVAKAMGEKYIQAEVVRWVEPRPLSSARPVAVRFEQPCSAALCA